MRIEGHGCAGETIQLAAAEVGAPDAIGREPEKLSGWNH
jgi:hypothetical protein